MNKKQNNSMEIKGKWEDEIYWVKTFIGELEKVRTEYFDKLYAQLSEDGFDEQFTNAEDANEFLFDYVYNHAHDQTFDEYLDRFRK